MNPEITSVLHNLRLKGFMSLAKRKNELYKNYIVKKTLAEQEKAELIEIATRRKQDIQEVLATLKEIRSTTHTVVQTLDSNLSKKKSGLVKIIDYLEEAQRIVMKLMQDIVWNLEKEVERLQKNEFEKALNIAVKEKKIINKIIDLGQSIDHDVEEEDGAETAWYSNRLEGLKTYISPLEYELQQNIRFPARSESHKTMTDQFTDQYMNDNFRGMNDQIRLRIVGQVHDALTFIIELSKTLTRFSSEASQSNSYMVDIHRNGFWGFIDEL